MIDLGVIAACTRGTATTINSRGETAGGFGGCAADPDYCAAFRGFYLQRGRPIVDVNTSFHLPRTSGSMKFLSSTMRVNWLVPAFCRTARHARCCSCRSGAAEFWPCAVLIRLS